MFALRNMHLFLQVNLCLIAGSMALNARRVSWEYEANPEAKLEAKPVKQPPASNRLVTGRVLEEVPGEVREVVPGGVLSGVARGVPGGVPNGVPGVVFGGVPGGAPNGVPGVVYGGAPGYQFYPPQMYPPYQMIPGGYPPYYPPQFGPVYPYIPVPGGMQPVPLNGIQPVEVPGVVGPIKYYPRYERVTIPANPNGQESEALTGHLSVLTNGYDGDTNNSIHLKIEKDKSDGDDDDDDSDEAWRD